ncbi:hypothetical protein [Solidesulfovibrio sp.]|uniref:hypothetical protein n=1 Tax=Solidesulfovibrio sp. TaxID=2910990 RepID=UPI00263547F4|nr:hypothetical protein [Solidesulfovibrio sp.]
MRTLAIYSETQGGIAAVVPDPYDPRFYRDLLLSRGFDDVPGCVGADADRICRTRAQVFYSTLGLAMADEVQNFMIGNGDLYNGCWAPNPKNAVPEYVGLRFDAPVLVTGFQFSSTASISDSCPMKAAPCGHPTSFALEGSNDEAQWTTLLSMTRYGGMRVTFTSPYADEDCSWWDDGVYLSDRMDIADPRYFLAYRMVVSAFRPDIHGNYNVAELVFYGAF